jgi:hypothetical protein
VTIKMKSKGTSLSSTLKPRKGQSTKSAGLRLIRATGRPLEPTHILLYQAEFARVYDKIQARFGMTDTSIWKPEDAQRAQKLLERCDRIIRAKFQHTRVVRYPTYAQLVRMIKFYNAELVFSLEPSSGDLVLVIQDAD